MKVSLEFEEIELCGRRFALVPVEMFDVRPVRPLFGAPVAIPSTPIVQDQEAPKERKQRSPKALKSEAEIPAPSPTNFDPKPTGLEGVENAILLHLSKHGAKSSLELTDDLRMPMGKVSVACRQLRAAGAIRLAEIDGRKAWTNKAADA